MNVGGFQLDPRLKDISAAGKRQKYQKGHLISHGEKAPQVPVPKLVWSKEELLSLENLNKEIANVRARIEHAKSESIAQPDDAIVARIAASIRDLNAVQLNALVLREQKTSVSAIARRLGTNEARMQEIFKGMYEHFDIHRKCTVGPRLKWITLQASWRKFVLDNAKL